MKFLKLHFVILICLWSSLTYAQFTVNDIEYTISSGTTDVTVKGYTGTNSDVTIPSTVQNGGITYSVTCIGIGAFISKLLTSVDIPNSVTNIEYYAFLDNSLTSINIPNSVISIGALAFSINSLISVDIPNSVTSIGEEAFSNNSLTSISISNSVTNIGNYAFRNNSLTSVDIPNSVTSLGDFAFSNNLLASVHIPNSLISIGNYTFSNNSLTNVDIPKSVTTIGDFAFANNSLTTLTIPNSVTNIGYGAFYTNSLTVITIPNSVIDIETNAFIYNPLTSVTSLASTPPTFGTDAFPNTPTLNIPYGTATTYTDAGWTIPIFSSITANIGVTNVSTSLASGTYGVGQVIPVEITLSQAVIVTGTPQLSLETGITDRIVDYTSGDGTNTLTFNYSVQAGDESTALDYIATNSLALNGGTIKYSSDNSDVALELQAPNTAGSLAANKAIIIDTTPNITWTGTTDNVWSTASNWSTGTVPPNTADIIIPSGLTNYPTTNVSVIFNSMVMNSGTTFIPNSTVTGSVTYKRNLPTTNWYLVAAPVSNETQQDIIANHTFASGSGSNIGIGTYDNDSSTNWIYFNAASTGPIISGAGVSIKLAAPGDVAITGDVIPNNVTVSISQGSDGSFNLLGNPYTAYMNSATFATTNSALLTEETVWLWNGTSYVTYNAVSPIEIAPAQGYFIEASTNSNVLYETINRSHQSSDTFMKQKPTSNFELFVESGDDKQATKVFYVADKTTGFDNGYDSKMFGGVTSDFSIFTELVANNHGKQLAIQTLPNENLETMVIPVGIIADAGKELTFSVTSLNLPENISVFLEDRVNNEFINLSNNEYKTTLATTSNGIGQFYVHTTSQKLSTDDVIQNLDAISIYKSAKQEITITGLQSDGKVSVYSLLGKKVFATEITSNGNTKISLPTLADGVYIVRLASEYGEKTSKIILD